jgi:hypothetical protein
MTIDLNAKKRLLTKQDILQKFNELEIFQKYINEPINVGGKPILSPIRKESNPSFGFFWGEGNEICFNDFKLGKGDFIQFLRLKFGLTYFEALSKVACDFDMQDDFICKIFDKTDIKDSKVSNITKNELLAKYTGYKLGKNKREWKEHDTLYWRQFGISLKTLKFFNVEAISFIHIGDSIYPADKYAYCFKELKDNVETYKIYQPYNEKFKWINNHDNSVWQGWTQLPASGNNLVITKSLKDVMCLYELGFTAVSLQSENLFPKRHVFKQLEDRFKFIEILYDNDYDSETNWGKLFGDKLATELGLSPSYIPDKYQSKDPSDLVAKYGKVKAEEIISKETLLPF